jgi:predicted nucleic acid-binding Zn ribbon protein
VADHLARPSGEPTNVFRRLREVFGDRRPRRKASTENEDAFTPGRDPMPVSGAFDYLTEEMGWMAPLAEADLLVRWREVVGDNIADHATPVGIVDETLTLVTDSSAWATQLRLMRNELIITLTEQLPEVTISQIVVRGPGAPSWKAGPKSVPGRGPRDTYG